MSEVANSISAMPLEHIPVLRPRLPPLVRLEPYIERIDAARCYSNYGPLHTELQDRLEAALGRPVGSVTLASSGTAALVGAILAVAGRARIDRPLALMPTFTFSATGLAAEMCGYETRLLDIEPWTWSISPQLALGSANLDRTGLIIVVAPFGQLPDVEAWASFRRATGIPVVIDAAASFELLGRRPREFTFEVPLALSFHATKSFATGEGGAVLCGDATEAERVTQALNFGFVTGRESAVPAINGKLSEYHAAVGLAELDGWNEKRAALEQVARTYRNAFKAHHLAERLTTSPYTCSSYVLFMAADGTEARRIEASLEGQNIGYRHWYGRGLNRQPHFKAGADVAYPVADRLAETLIGLPVAPDLTAAQVARVAAAVAAGIAR